MSDNLDKAVYISDVHAHLQDERLGKTTSEVDAILEAARASGVRRFVCAGTSPADWNRTAKIARELDGVYPMFGLHPWNVGKVSGDWLGILTTLLDSVCARDGKTGAALGEVGLDLAVKDCDDDVKKAQEDAFRAQLGLADERKIPVAVHSVRANERVLSIVKDYPNVPVWLFHGWTATPDEIERAVDLRAVFSFSSRSLAPNAVRARATVAAVPRDKILLESDGPRLLPPNGYAGSSDARPMLVPEATDAQGAPLDSTKYLLATANEICKLRRFRLDEFLEQVRLNERRFFQYWRVRSA